MNANPTKTTPKKLEDDFFGENDCDCYGDNQTYGYAMTTNLGNSNDTTYGELSQREQAAISRQHFVIGYHETYDEGYNSSLQGGFNDGYRQNYENSKEIGYILGAFAMNVALSSTPNTSEHTETNRRQQIAENERSSDLRNHRMHSSLQSEDHLLLIEAAHKVRNVSLALSRKSSADEPSIKSDTDQLASLLDQSQQQRSILTDVLNEVKSTFESVDKT